MSTSKKYDFSSVGESATSYQRRVSTAASEVRADPIGIKTPLAQIFESLSLNLAPRMVTSRPSIELERPLGNTYLLLICKHLRQHKPHRHIPILLV